MSARLGLTTVADADRMALTGFALGFLFGTVVGLVLAWGLL